MAVMLRFLGQASKQTSQHLQLPPAVTPKRLAIGGASPRTPKTPVDSSPFFGGQCAPPAFFQGEHELPPPPQPVAASRLAPGTLGGLGQRSTPAFFQGDDELPPPPQPLAASLLAPGPLSGMGLAIPSAGSLQGKDEQADAAASPRPDGDKQDAEVGPVAPKLTLLPIGAERGQKPPTLLPYDAELHPKPTLLPPAAELGAAGGATGDEGGLRDHERPALRGGSLPVLLGRQQQHSATLNAEPKLKVQAPEAVRAREAFLARQLRIAGRRLPSKEREELPSPIALEVELAQATRDAFLSRQTTIARRRLLAPRA